MSGNVLRKISTWGAALLLPCAGTANAQWYPSADPCQCVQPVAQSCYQTVPVTEYRQVKQTVRRPVVETQYVERPVTEYVPVVETRTAQVPHTTYQDVTECRTIQRDAGYWVTQYQPNHKISPCEYDGRPNLLGWLNRTGYGIRSAFTPNYVAQRQYVPNMVTQTIPVTRRVAIQGSREVTYNVTRMEPRTTTRKVAVNTVRYVDQEIVATQPVTVMRTVPIGTSIAYATSPIIGAPTQTVLQPSPDPLGTATAPNNNRPEQTANSRDNYEGNEETVVPRKFERDSNNSEPTSTNDDNGVIRRSSYNRSVREEPGFVPNAPQVQREEPATPVRQAETPSAPSIVRVNRWTARNPKADDASAPSNNGPKLAAPSVSIAGTTNR